MGRITRGLPSPAMAVAITALFVALGGTGYAATSLTSRPASATTAAKKKKPKPPANDNRQDKGVAKGVVLGLASTLSVKHAASADNATNANHASTADSATSATTATAAGNAVTVGGLPPTGLVREATGSGSVTLTDGTINTSASLTITAPGDGFVLVDAHVTGHGSGTGCPCETGSFINVDGNDSNRSRWNDYLTPDVSGNYASSGATDVFAVPAGSHTFAVRTFRFTGSGTIDVFSEISAIFEPYGSTGGSTLSQIARDRAAVGQP